MNRLIIIGNGFDLAHDLKSHYSDFIINFIVKALNDFFNYQAIDNPLLSISFTHGNGRFMYPPEEATPENYKQKVSFLRSEPEVEFEIRSKILSRTLDQIKNKKWVDIEREYFDILMECMKSRNSEKSITSLNKEFAYLKEQLLMYLQSEQEKSYIKNLNQYYISHFLESINELEGVDPNEELNSLYFLNFNYTDTIIPYYQKCKDHLGMENVDLNYIHGSLDKKYGEPVFGYGDEYDERYIEHKNTQQTDIFKNIKSYEYLREDNYRNLSRFINASLFEVYIFGHSCGLSDRTLLKEIFTHDNCKAIKVFYYEDKEGNNDYIEKSYEIARHFDDNKMLRNKVISLKSSSPMT